MLPLSGINPLSTVFLQLRGTLNSKLFLKLIIIYDCVGTPN